MPTQSQNQASLRFVAPSEREPVQSQSPRQSLSFFAPGRVNLIGEHMDYNGGISLPFAIERGIRFSILESKRSPGHFPETISIRDSNGQILGISKRDQTGSNNEDSFSSHKGTLSFLNGAWALSSEAFGAQPFPIDGHAEIVLETTLPQGAGLSSSAALSLGLITSFAYLLGVSMKNLMGADSKPCAERAKLARLAQRVEHEYAGTPCGLMDQIAILETQPGHCLSMNFGGTTPSFAAGVPSYPEFKMISLGQLAQTHKLLVLDSGRKHTLSDGSYETRRMECGEALGRILSAAPDNARKTISTLGQLFSKNPRIDNRFLQEHLSQSPTLHKRALFVLEERARSCQGETALVSGNLAALDTILSDGQDGLRELYEVSCPEIDRLVWYLRELKKDLNLLSPKPYTLIGGRMMGGGWGGSLILFGAVSMISQIEDRISEIGNIYENETGCRARIIETMPSPGLAFDPFFAS